MNTILPSVAGIYIIWHKPTSTVYVGQSNNIRKRWAEHRMMLTRNEHHNSIMQSLWLDSNGAGFIVQLHVECPADLSALERQRWLVKAERAVLNEFREKGIVANVAEPEIVATKAAIVEYQHERKANIKARDQDLVQRRKEIKIRIEKLKVEVSPSQSRSWDINRRIQILQDILKQSTGWRGFLNGRLDKLNAETHRAELTKLVAEDAVLMQRIRPIQQEIYTLRKEYNDRYKKFSKVQKATWRKRGLAIDTDRISSDISE
jgi:hypothetical protein